MNIYASTGTQTFHFHIDILIDKKKQERSRLFCHRKKLRDGNVKGYNHENQVYF